MKALILIPLLASVAHVAHAQIFDRIFGGGDKNTVSAELEWNCPSANYNSSAVREFPSRARIQVDFHYKKNGSLKYKLDPDIFQDSTIDRITGIFDRGNEPEFVTDIAECFQNFKNNYRTWLNANQESVCRQESKACGDQENIFQSFEGDLDQKSFVRHSREVKIMPRFFAGHSFHSASESDYRDAYRNFCSGDRSQEVLYTSKGFLQFVKTVSSNPLADVDTECLEQLDKFNKDRQLGVQCSRSNSFCAKIAQDDQFYKDYFSDLKDGRIEAFTFSSPASDNFSAYRQATAGQVAQIGKHIADNIQFYDWGGCYLSNRFGNGGSLYFYDNAMAQALPYILERTDKKCQKHILKGYLSNKYINSNPLEGSYCQRNPCETVKKSIAQFEENVQELLASIYGGRTAQNACFNDLDFREAGKEVEDFLKELENISSCAELEPGQAKVVAGNVTGVSADYALERIDEKNLQATVAIDISDGKADTSVTSDEMFQRIKSCMEVSSSYFKSAAGETIKVNIVSKEENEQIDSSKRPPVNKISIEPSGHRSNSAAYAETISCEVITHEVLHLMGLCDEYKETARQIYVNTETGEVITTDDDLEGLKAAGKTRLEPKYQCRSLATVDSVMSNQSAVFDQAVGKKAVCKCKSELCRDVVQNPGSGAREIYLTDVWGGIKNRRTLCAYKRLETVKAESAADLEGMPTYEVEKDDSSGFTFRHTELETGFRNGEAITWAVDMRYTCGGCQDEEGCDDLREIKNRIRNKKSMVTGYCPSGARKIESNYVAAGEAPQAQATFADDGFTLYKAPKQPDMSLLHPAHFARIKHGTCANKVKNYTKCASYAYKDRDPEDCPGRPEMCKDVNQWLFSDE